MPVKERRPRRPRSPRKRAAEVFELLVEQQGRAEWSPRYDPVTELVFTILSQHTSDVNSERAGHRLKSAYPSWDAVADADPEEITPYVMSAGLAKQKVPRIQETLKQVRELDRRLRPLLPGGNAAEGGEGVAARIAGRRAQDDGHRALFRAGNARHGRRHPRPPRVRAPRPHRPQGVRGKGARCAGIARADGGCVRLPRGADLARAPGVQGAAPTVRRCVLRDGCPARRE